MKNNSLINIIKELKKTSKGRDILFLVCFFLFMIFVLIYIRIGNSNDNYEALPTTNNIHKIDVTNEEEINNYTFDNYDVKVNLDDEEYLYDISYKDGVFIINDKINNKNYKIEYSDELSKIIYYELIDGNYVIIDKPIRYIDFLRQDILWVIYPDLYHESDTNYVDSKYKISIDYIVDINNLNRLINKNITDYSTKTDSIKLYFGNNDNLLRVSYDLDNYCRNMNMCKSNLEIDLERK